jgi:hypothetical protein
MLILHIGRGKVGSTTIQHAVTADRVRLKEKGILVPEGACQFSGNYVQLAQALRENTEIPMEFADLLKHNSDKTIFVSSEFLLTAPPASIDRIKELAGSHQVKVLTYVREYRAWVPSWYHQAVRTGKVSLDFDVFFSRTRPLYTLKAHLTPWIAAFGWESMAVRPAGQPLTKRDLLDDLGEFLGFSFAPSKDRNLAPSWLEVEFCRAVHSFFRVRRQKPSPQDMTAAVGVFRESAETIKLNRVEYLTLAQRRELVELFNDDAAWMLENTGKSFEPLSMTETTERAFLPSLAAAPPGFLTHLAERAAASSRLKALPELQAAVVDVCRQYSNLAKRYGTAGASDGPDRFPWEAASGF